MSRDIARERLKEIRTLQGWREAYKVAGLTKEGSDATKRRRLSRLINPKTSGAKKLNPKERQKINSKYRRREKKGVFSKARAQKAIDRINKEKARARKRARASRRQGGLTAAQLDRRERQYAPLTEEDELNLEEAFRMSKDDGGRKIRAEYAKHMSRIDPTGMSMDFRRRQDKAIRAYERDIDSDKDLEELV